MPELPGRATRRFAIARRVAVGVLGGGLVALGLVMVVTPGPAVVVVPAGLALLATEFERPRRWLEAARTRIRRRT